MLTVVLYTSSALNVSRLKLPFVSKLDQMVSVNPANFIQPKFILEYDRVYSGMTLVKLAEFKDSSKHFSEGESGRGGVAFCPARKAGCCRGRFRLSPVPRPGRRRGQTGRASFP